MSERDAHTPRATKCGSSTNKTQYSFREEKVGSTASERSATDNELM